MARKRSPMFNHLIVAALLKLRSRVTEACLGLGALLALSGCAAVQVKLGMKIYLEKIPLASIAMAGCFARRI